MLGVRNVEMVWESKEGGWRWRGERLRVDELDRLRKRACVCVRERYLRVYVCWSARYRYGCTHCTYVRLREIERERNVEWSKLLEKNCQPCGNEKRLCSPISSFCAIYQLSLFQSIYLYLHFSLSLRLYLYLFFFFYSSMLLSKSYRVFVYTYIITHICFVSR